MATIGQRNALCVVRETPSGLYLDGGNLGEILLPGRYVPKDAVPGSHIRVFIYRDSEDRLIATTETPFASVGEFALLRVVSVDPQIGAFLDWGLAKDLLLPIREQERRVRKGEWVVAYIFVDPKSDRIVASTRLNRHLNRTEPLYDDNQPVRLLIAGETPLGYKAIVENSHWGLLYHSDLPERLEIGQELDGYIRTIRPDGKIDLSLDRVGYGRVSPLKKQILEMLKAHGGHLDFDDQSTPEDIRATFGTSKKAFKQAIGALYRERRIRFTEPGIELLEEDVFRPGRNK